MSDRSVPSEGHLRTSALGLLERARELARQDRSTSSDCTTDCTTVGGGDKGDKSEKPPSTPRDQTPPSLPAAAIPGNDPEVTWRVQVMLSQIRPGYPIPFLVAREDPVRDGACLSCSLPLGDGERYRCATCLEAAILVLASLNGPPDGIAR